jgi:biopolymer transport protein ExbD
MASVAAQSVAKIHGQKGISVELPISRNAVAVPDADNEHAPVVTLTSDGSLYFGVNPIPTDALAEKVKSALLARTGKRL